jgi:hypothetical protein
MNANPTPPKSAAPAPPIAGPKTSPPIWAAEYSPNASPRRSAGVSSVIDPRAAGSYIAVDRPARPRRRMNGSAPMNTSGRNSKIPASTLPATISGTRRVRSATQPKIGSPTSRAAGHAAMTTPSVAKSTPWSRK